jgi:hypothetical protein
MIIILNQVCLRLRGEVLRAFRLSICYQSPGFEKCLFLEGIHTFQDHRVCALWREDKLWDSFAGTHSSTDIFAGKLYFEAQKHTCGVSFRWTVNFESCVDVSNSMLLHVNSREECPVSVTDPFDPFSGKPIFTVCQIMEFFPNFLVIFLWLGLIILSKSFFISSQYQQSFLEQSHLTLYWDCSACRLQTMHAFLTVT